MTRSKKEEFLKRNERYPLRSLTGEERQRLEHEEELAVRREKANAKRRAEKRDEEEAKAKAEKEQKKRLAQLEKQQEEKKEQKSWQR